MAQAFAMEIPKSILATLNNLYEIEKKLALHGDAGNAKRNIDKMKDIFAEMGVFYDDPMGQEFKETRTDLDATISGSGTDNLVVVEVIKPIIRAGDAAFSKVVQRGIVVLESREGSNEK